MADEASSESVNNEELTAFVASTLRAIASGIAEAQDTARTGARGTYSFKMPAKIAFDIAVSAKRNDGTAKGLKLEVFAIGGNISGQRAAENHSSSRITFEIPWILESSFAPKIPSTKTAFSR